MTPLDWVRSAWEAIAGDRVLTDADVVQQVPVRSDFREDTLTEQIASGDTGTVLVGTAQEHLVVVGAGVRGTTSGSGDITYRWVWDSTLPASSIVTTIDSTTKSISSPGVVTYAAIPAIVSPPGVQLRLEIAPGVDYDAIAWVSHVEHTRAFASTQITN